MAKMILFDFGGVLAEAKQGSAIITLEEEIYSKTKVKLFPFKEKFSPRYKEFQRGEISPEEYFQNLIKISKAKISVKELMRTYKSAYLNMIKLNLKMINLIKALHKKYKLALLSDTNEFHWQINKERGLDKLFDVCFTSSGLGATKHEAKVFKIVAEKLGIKPEDCIFIDDNEGHVERARATGIDAIQFRNYEQLVDELKTRKILT